MTISKKHVDDTELLAQELKKCTVFPENIKAEQVYSEFCGTVLANFPLEDWLGRNVHALALTLKRFYDLTKSRAEHEVFVEAIHAQSVESSLPDRIFVLINCDDSPFLVDSTRIVLNENEHSIQVTKSTILDVMREGGLLTKARKADIDHAMEAKDGHWQRECFIYFEIAHLDPNVKLDTLKLKTEKAIHDVTQVVKDYQLTILRLNEACDNLHTAKVDTKEAFKFLKWLQASNYTFLGYRELEFEKPFDSDNPSRAKLVEGVERRLGIYSVIECDNFESNFDDFPDAAKTFYLSNDVICFSKSNTRSTVHRNVYPDYIVVKKYNDLGQVVGETRFLGFYTYAVSAMSPSQIPVLRKKVEFVFQRSGLNPKSHDGKRLLRYINLHPKEELFQASSDQLLTCFNQVMSLNERDIVRVILRKDTFMQFFSCLVYVPREAYTTNLRLKIQALIGDALNTHDVDSNTFFSESKHARAHLVYRLPKEFDESNDFSYLKQEIIDLSSGWNKKLKDALAEKFGESKGMQVYARFSNAFPPSYQEDYKAAQAVGDIGVFASLHAERPIFMALSRIAENDKELSFRVIHRHSMLELSSVIPILEALGVCVMGEQPYRVVLGDTGEYWIHAFKLKSGQTNQIDAELVKTQFETAFEKVWNETTSNDGFNQLILAAGLSWREVDLLRAFGNYMKQTLYSLSVEYIAETLVSHPLVTQKMIQLFVSQFDPSLRKSADERTLESEKITADIIEMLDDIKILNQDKVFRRYLELIKGTLRVNFYQTDALGQPSPYISLKFNPANIPDIPNPRPAFEFFVYSARVEGVHLRTSKVARGGLRWSDRLEDYRTEVLGLVKAQQVKNAVIVPSGAKGGFVAKKLPFNSNRAQFLAEGVECYKIFIRGLLDLTDNIVDGNIVKPTQVVCLDGDDPYLVVAADKGTATFSDIANEISLEKKHWLGDAFASGGSQGYDHKGMGITAKGAWVSVQQHFRERSRNTQVDNISVLGVGDMGGDVFGNGMLLSKSLKLVAAFNHIHIFIDPSPDAQASFEQRQHLFVSPGSSWADYDPSLISRGGGVFLRSDKFISLSPEIQALIDSDNIRLTPTELIRALLCSKVDLIWNGGIGTYVKAKNESHEAVGDKTNDALRVNGSELRCRVFGEGGNLGMTQRGRIEFTLNGGSCNTDFIDNAAGVDCSDHEVNIKILLDTLVTRNELSPQKRNQLLVDMTESVSELVLNNNYKQVLALSVAQSEVLGRMTEYRRFIEYLVVQGRLDRELEFLPSDKVLAERIGSGTGLTRPELSVLLSYAKVELKEVLSKSNIGKDKYCAQSLVRVFPKELRKAYPLAIEQHKLRKEIIATELANSFVNHLGITASHRLTETTGSSIEQVVMAYVVSKDVFRLDEFISYVSSLDYQLEPAKQYQLIVSMLRRIRRGTRWFLKNRRSGLDCARETELFSVQMQNVQAMTEEFLTDDEQKAWKKKLAHFEGMGIKYEWRKAMVMPDNLFSGLGIIEVFNQSSAPIEDCVKMFVSLSHVLKLDWFASQLTDMKVENYWQASAREAYLDDLESQLRKLSIALLIFDSSAVIDENISVWQQQYDIMIRRWNSMVNKVEATTRTDYAMYAVALRELNDLVQATTHR